MDAQSVTRLRAARAVWPMAVAVVLAMGARPAGGETRPSYGGEIIAPLLGEPMSIDPVAARTHAELAVVDALCDTLYRVDAGGVARPHLATGAPEVSEDGKTARVTVRAGVKFHDGKPLGAADVVRSLERVRRHRSAGWVLASIASIEQDGDAVVLGLRRPTPELTSLLATPATSITSAGAGAQRDQLVGTGPFSLRLVDRRRRRIVLDAFDDHFDGRPYIDVVELRWYVGTDGEAKAYEAGDTHVSFRGAVAFPGHRPKHATTDVTGPATVLVYLGFGAAHADILDNVHFRRALSLATDRDSFRSVGSGEPVSASLQPAAAALGGPSPRAGARVARAQAAARELATAARDVAALRDPPTFEIVVDETRPDDAEVAKKVQAALFRLDLKARVTTLSAKQFDRRVGRGECDLYVGQLAPPSAEVGLEVAAAFAVADSRWPAETLAARELEVDAALEAFDARLPVVPLFHRAIRAHHRETLGGVGFDFLGRLSFGDLFMSTR